MHTHSIFQELIDLLYLHKVVPSPESFVACGQEFIGLKPQVRGSEPFTQFRTVGSGFVRRWKHPTWLPYVGAWGTTVERLYCKRPILCLSSSKILTPHPPYRPAIVYPTPFGAGGRKHSLGVEGGGGSIFWKMRDTVLYSTYVRKYFVGTTENNNVL